jgi:predicted nucleotide-binding protein
MRTRSNLGRSKSAAKPLVFVGSSTEAKPIVEKILTSLRREEVAAEPWWSSPAFDKANTTIAALLTGAMSYDFALFILAADDVTRSRGSSEYSVRDNVLFELGLFIGTLGHDRVSALAEKPTGRRQLKMPSDLLGVIMPAFTYDDDRDLTRAIDAVIPRIRDRIVEQGLRHYPFSLREGWEFDPETGKFELDLDPVRVERYRTLIGKRSLVLAIRKEDSGNGVETPVVVGQPDGIPPQHMRGKSVVSAGGLKSLGELKPEDAVEGYLLLGPENLKIEKLKTLGDLFREGCRILDSVACTVG